MWSTVSCLTKQTKWQRPGSNHQPPDPQVHKQTAPLYRALMTG